MAAWRRKPKRLADGGHERQQSGGRERSGAEAVESRFAGDLLADNAYLRQGSIQLAHPPASCFALQSILLRTGGAMAAFNRVCNGGRDRR